VKYDFCFPQDMRMSLCRALVLLRHKNLLDLTDLLQLFFELLKCQDKPLRKFLRDHIITDLKNSNAKHKVTRLGEFSPIGRLFTLGSFLNYKSRSNFRSTFFRRKKGRINFDKNGLGYIPVIFY
jgi:hypothetical protein